MSEPVEPARIEEIYVFIATESNGGEGIAGFKHDDLWYAMIASDKQRMNDLRKIAQQIAKGSGCPIKVCRFSFREEIEEIKP